jgi:ABC-type spermidine/putrescine transport system permease subunit I
MGGTGDLMTGILIERQIELADNWPVAAVMSVVLLAVTLAIYALYSRFADLKRTLSA